MIFLCYTKKIEVINQNNIQSRDWMVKITDNYVVIIVVFRIFHNQKNYNEDQDSTSWTI